METLKLLSRGLNRNPIWFFIFTQQRPARVFLFIKIMLSIMAITKAKKQSILSDVSTALKDAASIVFVHFKGLSTKDTEQLRQSLFDNQAGYKVMKKTLLKRALDARNISGDMPAIEGEIAIAYSTDLIASAREVHEFAKTHKGQISIVGGVFDGAYMDQAAMMEIATIPSVHGLRGMFVNVINSPIQGFVSVLGQIAEKKA